jgi:ABC-type dipeptide/oligopeptide/nickel transport system permease subunit
VPLGGLDDSEFAGAARSYWSRAFVHFLQHRFAVASLILLVLIFVAGLLASKLAPYDALMRLTDLLLTLPVLAVVLLAAAFLHADTAQKAAVVLACLLWTSVARVLRASALALREKEYVDSARASGASDLRIIMRHILPNAIGPLAAATSLMIATAIALEVTIAYLGFGFSSFAGLQAKPSIGDVLRQAQSEGYYHWWGITFPGLPIVLIVVAISFVAEGLRDSLDPTSSSNRRFSAKGSRQRRRALRIRAPEMGQPGTHPASRSTALVPSVRRSCAQESPLYLCRLSSPRDHEVRARGAHDRGPDRRGGRRDLSVQRPPRAHSVRVTEDGPGRPGSVHR